MRHVFVSLLIASTALAESWSVVLTATGPNKIPLVKEVRAATGKNLKETVELVNAPPPQTIKSGLDEATAKALAASIAATGASVELKRGPEAVAVEGTSAPSGPAYDVTLETSGPSKLMTIKIIRELTGLGLADAKKLAESAPVLVKPGQPKAQAEAAVQALVAVGAKASFAPTK